MFYIKYLILEDEKKNIKYKKNIDWEIEGQICLYFNDIEVGFYNKEINFGGEYLSQWFIILLETVKQLSKNAESFASIPETIYALHFVVHDNKLQVVKGKMEIQHMSGIGVYLPSNILEAEWETNIEYDEFQKEILDKTKQYIEEVSFYNKNFRETVAYRDLINLLC